MSLTVEDRMEIEDLLYRYANAMECGGEEDLLAIFTEAPILDSVVHGQNTGVEAIRQKSRNSQKTRQLYRLRRMFSNVRIHGDAGRANMTAYFVEFRTPLAKRASDGSYPAHEVYHVGEFECDVQKVDGAWLMERRAVRVDSRLGSEP